LIFNFSHGIPKVKKKIKTDWHSWNSIRFLKILAVVCVFFTLGVGFIFLNKYLKKVASAWGNTTNVELVNPPAWINQALRDKIKAAATALGQNVKAEEDIARSIQNNLVRNIAWLQKIRVQTTYNKILIEADYRKPIALVTMGQQKFYIDSELVVLDFVTMSNLPIVNVKGLPTTKMPPVGEVWQREDLAAAAAILIRLDRMDKLLSPNKPLLFEIDSIDISNYKGRKDSRSAHISLYTKDNTEIIWGAEIDAWAQHLEAKDEEKLAKLYNYYKECGTLSGGVKYIDLRTPQSHIPLPIDKY
jgi:hypothetical protein